MSRIQPNTTPDAKAQEQLNIIKQKLGSTPNIFTTLAHSPAALGFYLGGSAALNDSHLSAAVREQIALTVAGANACDYCASAHTAIGKMLHVADAELAQNLNGTASDAKVQAILTLSQKIVNLRGKVSDADVQAARTAGITEAELVEIVAIVAQNIFTNYFNHVADTAVDFPLVSTGNIKQAA